MINSYKQLSAKYLKANKKRSMLTIIGIILSVALISSIGLIYKSMEFAQVEQVKNSEGSFHLVYTNVDDNLLSKIKNNPKVSRYGLYGTVNDVRLNDNLYANEVVGTNKALELFTYRVIEGKLPEKEGELAVEKLIADKIYKNEKIGDKIKFNNKEYTLVGILQNRESNEISNAGTVLSINNNLDKEKSALVVEISPKTDLKTALEELRQLSDERTILENGRLILIEGGTVEGAGSGTGAIAEIASVIVGVVVICSIAVIYNSFQISIVDRIKQFGLLRAIGASRKQIRKIVIREATVMAIIAVPIGVLVGIIFIYGISIAFKIISSDSFLAIKPVIDGTILGISAAVGVISVYLSALLPVIFAGKISPIVAISSASAIKKEKIKRRKNKLAHKVFGFEGVMAAKNIKRNRNRYIITVFSIVISVVLFITFNYAINIKSETDPTPYELKNIDFSVVVKTPGEGNEKIGKEQTAEQILSQDQIENNKINKDILENIRNLNFVDKVYGDYGVYFFEGAINKDAEVKEVQDMGDVYRKVTLNGSEKTVLQSIISVYDREGMEVVKKYISSGTIDLEKMNKENGVILVQKSAKFERDKTYNGPMANLKVGDEVELQDNNYKVGEKPLDFGKGQIKRVKVIATVEIEPFNRMGNMKGIQLISTEEVAKNLTKNVVIKPKSLDIKIKDAKKEEEAKTAIQDQIKEAPFLGIINHLAENRREQASQLMIKVLAYGFIVVVSLIGSVNTINTLTTNIILRKKEFAALKSIGLTQKGLKKMIVFEGLLYGIVGTIYGSVISSGLCYLIYRNLYNENNVAFAIPLNAIAIAGAAALLIGYLSVLAPLSRIKKENIIEAIREE